MPRTNHGVSLSDTPSVPAAGCRLWRSERINIRADLLTTERVIDHCIVREVVLSAVSLAEGDEGEKCQQ